ncbi:MAG: GNAT family N-acetyltransferase [Candidatus Omnitrophica bacterium]|nr:GNAT family N-acetyltransferase [Candidatus Omnitrophota bacterium]
MSETLTAPATGSWAVQRLAVDELDALAAFQQQAYADQFHAGFFTDRDEVRRRVRWQYLDAPGAPASRMPVWVMRRGEAIIGQLAIVPVDVKIGGRRLRGGWCQDFVVAPACRKSGAGVWLLREAVRAVQSEMAVILAGGTNESSYPIFRFDGFDDLGALPRAVGVVPVVRAASFRSGRGIRVEPAAGAGEELEAWWGAREGSYAACARRDGAWWRWRFAGHPHWRYQTWVARRDGRMAGCLVLRSGSIQVKSVRIPTCRVVELAAGDHAAAGALMRQAAHAAARLGCRLLRCDAQDRGLDPRWMAWRGLWPVSSRNRVLIKVADRRAVPQAPPLSEWFLSAADSDFDLYEPR